MKKKLLFALSLSFLLLVFLFLGSSKENGKNLFIKGNSFIEGLRIVQKKNGVNVWTLTAKRADITESEDKANLSDIAMTIESKGMTIYAKDGVYGMSTRNLTLQGKITAVAKGYTITADSAEWDQAKGGINTKGAVRLESKKFNVEGSGMEIDSEQKVRVTKNVKATFYR